MPFSPLNLGKYTGDKSADGARTGGYRIQLMLQDLYAKLAGVSGLNLVAGPVTKLAPGANPTATLTGTAPNFTLNLGLPEGAAGAGAPNSADILAIAEKDRLERSIAAAGVAEEPSLILDFVRGTHFASRSAVTASILTLLTALGGVSVFSRSTTATYWDSDGLMKVAAIDVPRVEYDPVTRLCRGLLLENNSRTNTSTYSEQLDQASYGKARCSVVANVATDPFGTTTMDKIVEDATLGNSHYLYRTTVAGDPTVENCFSGFVKLAERSRLRLNFRDADTATRQVWCDFNLSAGTAGVIGASGGATAGNAGIRDCGNGIYRIWVTGTMGAGTALQTYCYLEDATGALTYDGDGSSGLYAWGWQTEPGNRPSSYIPTPGASAVTRGIDILTIGSGPWFQPRSGLTCAVECSLTRTVPASTLGILRFQNASGPTDYMVLRQGDAIGGIDFVTISSNGLQADSPGYASPLDTTMRLAFSIDAAGWSFAKDNVSSYGGGASTLPVSMDRLNLAIGFNGYISKLIFYPQRLSAAKGQILSSTAWN